MRVCFPALLILTSVGTARGQLNIRVFEPRPGDEISNALAISPMADVVAGVSSRPPTSPSRIVRWTEGGGSVPLPLAPGSGGDVVTGITNGGAALVGYSSIGNGTRAFRWTQVSGFTFLQILPNPASSRAHALSGDGGVAVGESDARPVYWDPAGQVHTIGPFEGQSTSGGARDVSSDGTAIVGSLDSDHGLTAFRWSSSGGLIDIGTRALNSQSAAVQISGDGSAAVVWDEHEYFDPSRAHQEIFLANAEGGREMIVSMPVHERFNTSGISFSGDAIVGSWSDNSGVNAALWTRETGLVDLNEWLPTIGLQLNDWELVYANDVSADGNTIVGLGWYQPQGGARALRGWVAHIPAPSSAAVFAAAWLLLRRKR